MTAESQPSAEGDPGVVTGAPDPPNAQLGISNRVASAVVGGALVLLGLRRRSLVGAVLVLVGGWLLYRGGSGQRRPGLTGSESVSSVGSDRREHRDGEASPAPMDVERSTTVGKSADELDDLWRDPETLTRVVGGVAEVNLEDEDMGRYRWRVDAPLGRTLTGETRIVEDCPGEFLRWESVENAAVSTEGSLRFRPAPAGRGTEVTLRLRFDPPGGPVGGTAMNLLGFVPETLASSVLYRFKSLAETGEIPTLERNPSARGKGDLV
ncbi:SRPBCC family protein [Haloprofundus salilacus]|uniref:SRPBCC family protein n=1 Tax=Haloprofundus salilacus TaxID=2876190 RepID=UPI001CCD6B91|nr:SRPBCC family protein [Haloprofundus salilacus]